MSEPRFEMLDSFGPLEMFAVANRLLVRQGERPCFEVMSLAEDAVTKSFGGPYFRMDQVSGVAEIDGGEGWKTRDSSVWGWLLTIFTHGFSILSVVWNPSFCSLLKPCKRKKTRWRDPLVSLRMTSHRWTKRTHGTGNARMAWWYRFLGLLLWTGIQNCDVSKDRLLLDLYFPWSLLKSGWLPEVSMGTYLWRTSLVFFVQS